MDPTLPAAEDEEEDGTSSGVDEATLSGTVVRRLRVRDAVPGTAVEEVGEDGLGTDTDETTGSSDAAEDTGEADTGATLPTGLTSLNPSVEGGGGRTGIAFSEPGSAGPPKTLL